MQEFDPGKIKELYKPDKNSNGEDNGQVIIIGGSDLFHGAPLLALKAASKIVDMVFFSSPEEYFKEVTAFIKSELSSFIWVPWEEVDKYIEKSDACLIGPGFKRYKADPPPETLDGEGAKTRELTRQILEKHKDKKWVIDAGSLQTIDAHWIPENAIVTPNLKEYKMLFGDKPVEEASGDHKCVIVKKAPETEVCSPDQCVIVRGGNAGLTKGGTGDVLAGLTLALYAKNNAYLSAASASFIVKRAAEDLAHDVGIYFSADDLAQQIPVTLAKLSL